MAEESDPNVPKLDEPPGIGLKLSLNHIYPLQSQQIIRPRANQIWDMAGLSTRYLGYYVCKRMKKRKPIMDYLKLISAQRIYGCPIGGIGGGTIGRGFKGEFCRFQLVPGLYEYMTVPECQFIVNIRNAKDETIFQSVLSTYNKPKKAPSSWEWNLDCAACEYTALYPRAWTTYDLSKYGVKIVCRQISPVIPHNYKDSSLPCAVFVYTVQNVTAEKRTVSITFTWTEIEHKKAKLKEKLEIERYAQEHAAGVSMEQSISGAKCTFTIAKTKLEHESIHEGYCIFNAAKESAHLWDSIRTHGKAMPHSDNATRRKNRYRDDSIALSGVVSLEPGAVDTTDFCLTWDMPTVTFQKDSVTYKRYYTKYFGSDGLAGSSIASYALSAYPKWEEQIEEWQKPILNNSNLPDSLKGALMNELYYVADGGTVWFDVEDEYPESDPRHTYGLFGYLEGHEYRMYNTYDVHFYASFALAQLWPNLQVVVQYMFRDTVNEESEDTRKSLYGGKTVKRKVKMSIPHDLGDPSEEPFRVINAYNIHDVSEWRDLNPKFVTQVLRDYRLLLGRRAPLGHDRYQSLEFIDDVREGTEGDLYLRSTHQMTPRPRPQLKVHIEKEEPKEEAPTDIGDQDPRPATNILELLYASVKESDPTEDQDKTEDDVETSVWRTWDAEQYLRDMYPTCVALTEHMKTWDKDGDGLIENSGFPDQTFDAWVMSGPSAYCGGLWLATLFAMRTMAQLLGRADDAAKYDGQLQRARGAYEEKLWNGAYYRFDCKPANSRVVMADQLCGQWFIRASGFSEEVWRNERVRTALRAVYENNVLRFNGGRMGAVNGYIEGRKVDHAALQSEEMWVGVTYGLAALMIYEGMHKEALKMAVDMHTTLTQMGLSFETPEALYENGNHRSVAYMRPLAIWGIYQAITDQPTPQNAKTSSNGHIPDHDAKGL